MIWPAPFEFVAGRLGGLSGGSAGLPSHGVIGGFVLGTTLGVVWTPCAGPVLGSILTIVATSKDTAWASLQLVVYVIGAAIPMLAIAYGGQAVTTRIRRIARLAPRLQQEFGFDVIAFAICSYFTLSPLSGSLLVAFSLQHGFGCVLIAFAIASYFQYETLIVAWLTSFYPNGQIGL
jgi:thiol:disulfide interchange protein